METPSQPLDPKSDEEARSYCTPKQVADLEEMPARLPFLPMSDLMEEGLRTRRAHNDIVSLIRAEIEDPDEGDAAYIMQRALAAEYLLRRTCFNIADELERRRTGVAPRAKGMN